MGYYLGRAKLEESRGLIAKGLVLVIIFHGVYDFLVIGNLVPIYFIYGLVILFYLYLGKLIKQALRSSPFR
jgi:RsiW-degrading membrane proteinase PrsW (M82 family)